MRCQKLLLLVTGLTLVALFDACCPALPSLDAATTQAGTAPIPTATHTPIPTHAPTVMPSSAPTRTPTPTCTPTPTAMPTHTPTPTPCLPNASLVADITVPDGAKFAPGERFTKVWRVQSSGCAPWPSGVRWAFVSGDRMGALDSVPVPETSVGETADIAVEMIAPEAPGTYQGFWQMQDPSGVRFGQQAYVQIVVPGAPTPGGTALIPVTLSGSMCVGQLSLTLYGPATYEAAWCPDDWATCGGPREVQVVPGTYEYAVTGCGGSVSGTVTLEGPGLPAPSSLTLLCSCRAVFAKDPPSRNMVLSSCSWMPR